MLVACGGIGEVSSAGTAQAGSGAGGGTRGPTIQGTPRSSVAVGQAYSFQPATSADSGTLTFSAQNLPSWLTLDRTTGRLSGTPTDADVGSYAGVTIEVSDGASTARLGPFTITVSAIGSGTASLSWTAPTQNADGSALTDLAGYVVVYGLSPTSLTQTITISNPSVTTYVVENLSSGMWYFAVQATNSRGMLSDLSSVASKTIS